MSEIDRVPPGYATATVGDVVATLETARRDTPVLLELGAGLLGGPLGAPVHGLGTALVEALDHYALVAGDATIDDCAAVIPVVCVAQTSRGPCLTVGALLDALANLRAETPFLLTLGAAVAGPASWPQLTQAAPLPDVEAHYVLQPSSTASSVPVVVFGLPAGMPAAGLAA